MTTPDEHFESALRQALSDDVDLAPSVPDRYARVLRAVRSRKRTQLIVGSVVVMTAAGLAGGGALLAARPSPDGGGVDTALVGAEPTPENTSGRTPEAEPEGGEATCCPSGPAPEVEHPVVGESYPHNLFTHCGVTFAQFGQRLWKAFTPLVEEGVNAPRGWGNPFQAGTVTLLTMDRLRFTAEGREPVDFYPTDETPVPCS